MTGEKNIVRVSREIVPVHYSQRSEPELKVGGEYYVCFGNNIAYPCTLKEIIPARNKRVVVSKYDQNKQFGEHVLFGNEIGLTPEEAVRNSVSF